MNKKIIVLLLIATFAIPLVSIAQMSDSVEIHQIEEVKVTAYRTVSNLSMIPHQLKVIKSSEISGLSANSIDDVLKKTASIDLVQYPGFNSTISMRGFAPTSSGNTLILIDGIPVGTENVSTLSAENVSQLEVLKGPFSSFFGSDAMSGVINIATKKSKGKISGLSSLSYGSFNTFKIQTAVGGNLANKVNFDLYANAYAQRKNFTTGSNNLLKLSDYEKLIMDEKSFDAESKNTKYWQYSLGGRLGFELGSNWEINLNQEYWLAKDIQANGTFWGIYEPLGKDISRWSQSISFEGKINTHKIKIAPYFSNENTNFFSDVTNTNFKTSDYNYKTYGLILNDAITFGKHQIIIGADNQSKKYISKQWADANNPSSPYQPDYLDMATGVYFQTNLNFLNQKLNASFGGRYDNIVFKLFETEFIESVDATEKYNVFTPNFGIQYKFLNEFKIHAAAGRAFLSPDAFKVAGNYTTSGMYGSNYKGNPDLKPETSVTYDFGISYNNQKSGVNLDITYFTTDYKDMVVYDYSNMEYTSFINADKAKMDGLEVSFEYDFGAITNYNYSLKVYLDYTHLFNAKSKSENDTAWEQIKYVRMDKASFGVNYENKKGLAARINARYIGKRFEDNWTYNLNYSTYERIPYLTEGGQEIRPNLINEDVLEHPDFLVIDISTSYTISKKFIFGLKIDNLFNDNYTEKDTYYMPGRTYLASISYKF